MRWIERGDIDGFFGLALDNFVQLLMIESLCRIVLGFPDQLLYGRILPGVAVSLLIGNLYYAWQARQLAKQTGRNDVCALPYGINTLSLIAHILLVMAPALKAAQDAGASHDDAVRIAWHAGIVACIGSALIEIVGAFFAEHIRRATPRAALLATLAGIALTFIALDFFFRTYARPEIGLVTLGVVLLVYFGRVRFKGRLPGGLVTVAIGTALAWLLPKYSPQGGMPDQSLAFYAPIPVVGDLIEGFQAGHFQNYLSIIIPMGVFNVLGSLQNIESAEAAGDSYPTRPSLLVNGIGSLAAAVFGSCFPTTIYIGHPGWKAMGSRAGYSVLNGVAMTVICLSGSLAILSWLIPIDAGMAIVLWIGIVITAQAFQAVPREHAPAVVMGLLPGVAAWGALMAKRGLWATGMGMTPNNGFSVQLLDSFKMSGTWIHGAFALEQGCIFSSMILAAITVKIIERRFVAGALWCFTAAIISLIGLMHSYRWTYGDTAIDLAPAVPWAIGYAAMGLLLLLAPVITEPGEGH
ncbi:MAG TPA: NCS2 family permease [Planctomycetota bacterium]|nr:NCS2 family permease [Planctomycetota bacterium]